MALNALEQSVARRLKEKVLAAGAGHILELRVFGSRARGDARPESDLDLFIMLDCDDRALRRQVCDAAFDVEVESGFPFLIHPVVMSRDHFEDLLRGERMIAREIATEGLQL